MLGHLGLPAQMARPLKAVWSQQRRWLRRGQWASAHPEHVQTNVPQGEALAPLATLACLLAPTLAVSRGHPTVQQTVLVDGRALTCQSVPSLLEAVRAWQSWSRRLGLAENLRKLQLLTRTFAQAEAVRRLGWAAHQRSVVRVLGLGLEFTRVRTSAERPANTIDGRRLFALLG